MGTLVAYLHQSLQSATIAYASERTNMNYILIGFPQKITILQSVDVIPFNIDSNFKVSIT